MACKNAANNAAVAVDRNDVVRRGSVSSDLFCDFGDMLQNVLETKAKSSSLSEDNKP